MPAIDLQTDIAANLAAVRSRVAAACERAGRSQDSVELVGASKTMAAPLVMAALDAGLTSLGENYVQDAEPKILELRERGYRPTWRMIGHLQTNKVGKALDLFDTIDSVDSIHLAQAIDRRAVTSVDVLIEVNLLEEPSKTGCRPADLPHLLDATTALPHLDVRGLMTIGPLGASHAEIRPVFARLRELAGRYGFARVSMGMTDDFEVAIEEGSTIIRVGRAIFGDRPARS